MEIDDIVDILVEGDKEEIKNVLEDNKISYSFSVDGEYTIKNGKTYEVIRGHGILNPNCVKYFGKLYNS
jgi:hypothetical protein